MKSISRSRGGTVEITSILRPTVTLSIDLRPFVEDLRRRKNASKASKCPPYLVSGPATKIEDHYSGTVNKRETAFVEVVLIATDLRPSERQVHEVCSAKE